MKICLIKIFNLSTQKPTFNAKLSIWGPVVVQKWCIAWRAIKWRQPKYLENELRYQKNKIRSEFVSSWRFYWYTIWLYLIKKKKWPFFLPLTSIFQDYPNFFEYSIVLWTGRPLLPYGTSEFWIWGGHCRVFPTPPLPPPFVGFLRVITLFILINILAGGRTD